MDVLIINVVIQISSSMLVTFASLVSLVCYQDGENEQLCFQADRQGSEARAGQGSRYGWQGTIIDRPSEEAQGS